MLRDLLTRVPSPCGAALACGAAALLGGVRPAVAAPSGLPAAFVRALMRDAPFASCAAELGLGPADFARGAVRVRPLRLRTGERMLTVEARDAACLCENSVCAFSIYRRMPGATWRRVLDAETTNEPSALPDGTATVDAHESVAVIDELTYVWNGEAYLFAPDRSLRSDARFGTRPYRTLLRFARGATRLTRAGTAYGGFGDDYAFTARAGQVVTLRIDCRAKLVPRMLSYGPGVKDEIPLTAGTPVRLPASATYAFSIEPEVAGQKAAYRLRLTLE